MGKLGCLVVLVLFVLLVKGGYELYKAPVENQEATVTGLEVLPWDSKMVQTICIVGHESYADVADDYTPIVDKLTHYLEREPYLFTVVESDCDAQLNISVSGDALSAIYLGLGERYTGASIKGHIMLTAPGYPALSQLLNASTDPLESVNWDTKYSPGYATPADAPYFNAIRPRIDTAFHTWFGPEIDTRYMN